MHTNSFSARFIGGDISKYKACMCFWQTIMAAGTKRSGQQDLSVWLLKGGLSSSDLWHILQWLN